MLFIPRISGAKPRKGGLLHSLLCCWRRRTESGRLRGVGGNDQADQVDQGVAHNHLVQGGLHVANATGNSAATQLSTGQHDGANKVNYIIDLIRISLFHKCVSAEFLVFISDSNIFGNIFLCDCLFFNVETPVIVKI